MFGITKHLDDAMNSGSVRNAQSGVVTNDFIGGSGYFGGAIDNSWGDVITSVKGDFISNSADFSGGAIYNEGHKMDSIDGDFISNSASERGGAIFNAGGTITKVEGNFVGNSAYEGGAIYTETGEIASITGNFIGNSSANAGGAINNAGGSVGLLAQNGSIELTGNTAWSGQSFQAIFMDANLGESMLNMNAYGQNRIVVNDEISSAGGFENNVININNGLDGSNQQIANNGQSFGVVEVNNKVGEVTLNVLGGTLKAGSYKGGVVALESGGSITTKNSIAQFADTKVRVGADATLLIGKDVNGDESVLFGIYSDLTLEDGSTLAFEAGSSVVIDGTFLAENATLLFELSDYVADLEGDETFDLDWTFATFYSEGDAAIALEGFSDFKTDLGIGRGDKLTDGLWFDVVQEGNSLKVVGVIPEPATIGLLGLMSGALLFVRRRFF